MTAQIDWGNQIVHDGSPFSESRISFVNSSDHLTTEFAVMTEGKEYAMRLCKGGDVLAEIDMGGNISVLGEIDTAEVILSLYNAIFHLNDSKFTEHMSKPLPKPFTA